MRSLVKLAAFFLSFMLVALTGFGYGTYRSRNNYEKVMEKILVDSSSSYLHVHIGALDRLRSGKQDNAIELLEGLVDVNLASLAAHTQFIAQDNNEEVRSHVRLAKDYREKYPGHTVEKTLENAVNRALSLAK